MSHIRQFTCASYNIFTAEQLTRVHVQFPTNHVLVRTVITLNNHLVNRGLSTLGNTDFQIDRIFTRDSFDRHQTREQIPVILVYIGYGILVRGNTFIQVLTIIYITFPNIQYTAQRL